MILGKNFLLSKTKFPTELFYFLKGSTKLDNAILKFSSNLSMRKIESENGDFSSF